MRLTIVGGGGFRVPLVYEAVANARDRAPISEVILTDDDPARLAAISRVLAALNLDLPVRTTPHLDEALRDAGIIFVAVRVGGTRGRIVDEQVALRHGLLGQETIGPGGLAFAIRTLGVMEDLAARALRTCPEAWIINFTNPAGLITEAMQAHNPRVVGICDTPIGLVRRVGRALDIDPGDADIGYIGINHLGWLRTFTINGVDHLPRLLADRDLLARIEEARILGPEWVRTMGALPNEYLYYYTYTREAIAAIRSGQATRGEFLDQQQETFYARVGRGEGDPGAAWRKTLAEREATYMAEARDGARESEDLGGGYHEVAVDLMASLLGGEPSRMILNVANAGAIAHLPRDAVVEMPCEVDSRGVHQIRPATTLELDQLALLMGVKAAERALIEAVRRGSRAGAWRAFALHPLVDSAGVARELLEDYTRAHPGVAAALPHP